MKTSNRSHDFGELNGKPLKGFASQNFEEEAISTFATKFGDNIKCAHCGDDYERGVWDFHKLCPDCFARFDRQKMAGRIKAIRAKTEAERKEILNSYFESAVEWSLAEQK